VASYEQNVNDLHAALTGSNQLGQYPNTVVDRLLIALDRAWELVEAAGLGDKAPVIAGSELGPWTKPTTKLEDIRQQTLARYRHDEQSRPRTLAEAARQLEALVSLLVDVPSAPDPTAPVEPAPTVPPTPSIVPAGAKLVGYLDYDTGDLTQWRVLQTKDRNSSPGSYNTWRASVRDGGPGHPKAARFEVRPGDVPNFGGGERSEVQASSTFDVREGMESYYTWSMRLGDPGGSFPGASGWGLIVMQWHSNEGSPPLAIHAQGGQISFSNNRPGGYRQNVCPIDPGNWHDYVLRVKWGRDANRGLVEMWRDGQKLASRKAATTVNAERNYLKQGIYRDRSSATHVVWHDHLRVYTA
jgi:hypothetical protein